MSYNMYYVKCYLISMWNNLDNYPILGCVDWFSVQYGKNQMDRHAFHLVWQLTLIDQAAFPA